MKLTVADLFSLLTFKMQIMNEKFLRIKRIDTDTVVIPETNNKFEYHRLKDLLDEYYEWRVNKLNKSDVISSVCNHNFNDGINLRDTCKNCGVKRNTLL